MAAGRPPKFRSAKQLQAKIEEYFADCDRKAEQYTITGLTIALGFLSRQSLLDYVGRNQGKEQFADIIKKAKLQVEHSYELKMSSANPTGAIFVLKNFGWKDKQEHQISGPEGGRTLTTLELSAKIIYLVKIAAERQKQLEGAKQEKEPAG